MNSETQGRNKNTNVIVPSSKGSLLENGPEDTFTKNEKRVQRINAHELTISTETFNQRFGEELNEMEQTYVRWDNINFFAPVKKASENSFIN
jgi:hypothetical protein